MENRGDITSDLFACNKETIAKIVYVFNAGCEAFVD